MGCRWLVFGSEHPEMDYDQLMAHLPSDPATFKRFDQTYASLFQGYLREQTGITLNAANDILGFFYALANRRQGNPLELLALARKGSQHNDQTIAATSAFASATSIRSAALSGDWDAVAAVVPATTLAILKDAQLTSWEDFWPNLRYQLVSGDVADLRQVYQITEGVEYRLKRAALPSATFADFMHAVKTKRYTYTRLQRQSAYLLGQMKPAEMDPQPQYLRVLGYSAAGQRYLHQIKKQVNLPLISRADRDWQHGPGELDDRLGALRTLITGIPQDYGRIPVKITLSE